MSYTLRCAILTLAATACLTAQRGGNSGGNGSGSTNSGGNGGGAPANAGPSQPSQAQQSQGQPSGPAIQMPVFISGRVMMDDGSPPPVGVGIQRTCAMTTRTVAFTSAKGDFSFQWGGRPGGLIPDASEVGTFGGQHNLDQANTSGARAGDLSAYGVSNMVGCELTANAPGFRSDRFDLSNQRSSDNPDIGVIVLHRLANVEGTSVSATSFSAPKDARKAWEKGVQLLHKSKNAEAEKELQKAVDIYPKYAAAWADLGRARLQQKRLAPAREAFLKATEADAKLVEPQVALGEMALREKNWADAAKYFDRALQLDPVDYPKLWFAGAVADYNARNYERAEKNARAAVKVNPPNHNAHADQLLGLILLNKHDYAGADDALREYVKLSPYATDLNEVKAQLSEIEGHLDSGPGHP